MTDTITTEQRGPVLLVTLNRPKANAIDCQTSRALYSVFSAFQKNPALRVAILTGSGSRFFSAGWDLKAAAEGEAVDADHGPGGFAGLTEYFDLTKPVIGAINGMAVGGGFELALACDLLVAAEHTQFFLPEVQIGIAPDSGGVFRLPKRLPRVLAMEMLLTGKRLSAREAQMWGVVNNVVPSDQLLFTAWKLAETLCTGAPLAQQAIKELVNQSEGLNIEDAFSMQRHGDLDSYQKMLASEDAKEGIRAFNEARQPIWHGA